MTELRSANELFVIGRDEARARKPSLTDWTEGSINDAYVGSSAIMVQEAFKVIALEFAKTLLASATGADLEFLATDHFGPDFARPDATKAIGVITFSRPTTDDGNVTIPIGTIVKTETDANGESQRFETTVAAVMTGLTLNVTVQAIVEGTSGNVEADTITLIESTLTDNTITVNNDDATTGGLAELNDADYREYIYAKIGTLKGATKEAVRAAALTVAGVVYAEAEEFIRTVIEYDESTSLTVGDSFKLAMARLYIGDANGEANAALLLAVRNAVDAVRATGVYIEIIAAIATSLSWTATITLDSGGPNYASLSVDATPIVTSMISYIQNLPIGQNFNLATARAAILAIWGPAGSGDLTDFETLTPTGNVSAAANVKFIPDAVSVT